MFWFWGQPRLWSWHGENGTSCRTDWLAGGRQLPISRILGPRLTGLRDALLQSTVLFLLARLWDDIPRRQSGGGKIQFHEETKFLVRVKKIFKKEGNPLHVNGRIKSTAYFSLSEPVVMQYSRENRFHLYILKSLTCGISILNTGCDWSSLIRTFPSENEHKRGNFCQWK